MIHWGVQESAPLLERDTMKKDMILTIIGFCVIMMAGGIIFLIPYKKAAERNASEDIYIEEYLETQAEVVGLSEEMDTQEETESEKDVKKAVDYEFSDVDTNAFKGEIDSILVIDKINLKKAIIRGEYNDYNLDKYYFVTADQNSALGEENYVIYGHCSQTYGHSFNRLEEMAVGDEFQLIQGMETYEYIVSDIQRELRENASPLLETGDNTVQLLSCERKKAAGYPEKRLIIVTAQRKES